VAEPTIAPAATFARVPYGPGDRSAWRDLPFDVAEYRRRIAAVQARLAEAGLGGAVVHSQGTDIANLCYLTGWSNPLMGDAVLVVPERGEPALVTDAIVHGEPMHTEIYQAWLDDVRCSPHTRGGVRYRNARSITEHLTDCLADRGLTSGPIGLAGPWPDLLRSALGDALPGLLAEPFDAALARQRAVKSDAEQALMRQAADIAETALAAAVAAVRPGVSEHDVVAALYATMMSHGADGPLYFVQVVAGPRAGFRNVRPTARPIQDGDPVYIGFGLRYRGYCARAATGLTAGAPSQPWHRLLDANRQILQQSLPLARPGAAVTDMVSAGAQLADELGIGDETWVGGHGIGLHTHDLPTIGPDSTDTFETGMTFIYEPMICRTGLGTANSERVYLMTDAGPQPLAADAPRFWEK
jgi:Xaa-Pro aminopeptidase